jgi:flagellar protein FlgJ
MTDFMNNIAANSLTSSRFQLESGKLNSLQDDLHSRNKTRLKEAAQQFEAVFVHQLLQVMDKTVQRSDFMHGGQGEKIFRDMFYQEIAKEISTNSLSNFGLGQQVYDQLSKQM